MLPPATVRTALCRRTQVSAAPLTDEQRRCLTTDAGFENVVLLAGDQVQGPFSIAQLAQQADQRARPAEKLPQVQRLQAHCTLGAAEQALRDPLVDWLLIMGEDGPLGIVTRASLLQALAAENSHLHARTNFSALGTIDPRLQRLIDALPFFVALSDRDGKLKFLNRAMLEAMHAQGTELLGQNLSQTYWFNFSPETSDQLRSAAIRAAQGEQVRLDLQVRIHEDDYAWIDTLIAPLFDEHGQVQELVGSAVNITERRNFEEQAQRLRDELAHALRLSTLGEMAIGIAHELNQPLTAITNYAYVARQELARLPGVQESLIDYLDQIQQQAIRAGGIIRGLKTLIRKAPAHRSTVDLNTLIQSVVDLLATELRMECIELIWQHGLWLPPVLVDTVQIQQVLLNLLRNSLEALRSVTEVRQITLITQYQPAGGIEVYVRDNGPGIPEWIQVSLFAPFTTSKVEGLGLGLVISRRIIEAHGGVLKCESSSAAGTTFLFTLPVPPSESAANAH